MPGVGTPERSAILNLGGGQNDGDPATHIGDNEVASLLNFYPWGPRVRRRMGTARITSTPWTSALTSLFAYKTGDGVWTLIAGAATGLARLDGSGLIAHVITDAVVYVSSLIPWVFSQYNDIGYATRRSTGTLKRFKTDFMQDAGIAAPSVKPTLADGGAGTLTPAASYFGVYTFYNSDTGAESNPSPVSTVLALGNLKDIDWSAIGVSTNGQVNARRLYRTLPDQQGQYFFVAQINDNLTTTYSGDQVAQSDLGDPASFSNGLPPSPLSFHALFKERLWATDEVDLFFSEIGRPESFDPESVITVFKDDGHKIRGLHAFGERLMIGKTNAIRMLIGSDPSDFQIQTLTDRHGCTSHYSMKNAEGFFYWFGGDDVYGSDGVSVESISDPKVKTIVENIPSDQKENVRAAIYPPLSWYVLAVASGAGQTTNNYLLVYNYKTRAWGTFRYFDNVRSPRFIGDFYDVNAAPLLYALFEDDYIYNLLSGVKDVTTSIVAKLRTKAYGYGMDYLMKTMRRIAVLTSGVAGTLTARLYLNLTNTAHKTRTGITMATPSPWKPLNLSNVDKQATCMQVEIEYSGDDAIDISGLEFEITGHDTQGQPQ